MRFFLAGEEDKLDQGVTKIIGRKLGAVFALSILCMTVLMASPANALTVDNTLSLSDTSLKWDEGLTVYYNCSVNAGYIWWNGTATLYLVNPEGTNTSYGSSVINLGSSVKSDWANWSVQPKMSGTWTVWVTHAKTSGNGTYAQVTNETTTFTQESAGDWMNRTVQDWVALWWLLFGIVAIVLVLVVMLNRVNRESGGKKL